MAPALIAIQHRSDAHGESFDAIVDAGDRDVEAVEVATPATLESVPPLVIGGTFELRNELIAFLRVAEGRMIDANLSTDRRALRAIHLAADDEQIAVDARAFAQQDVGVDRQHASRDMAGNGHGTIQHGDIPRHRAPALDLEHIGRPQRDGRVEQRYHLARDVAR